MDETAKEEIAYTKENPNVCNTTPSVVDCDTGKQLSNMLKLYS